MTGPSGPASIHPTAVIDAPCTIGDGSKIWHFCHVSAGARIGARCVLGQNVYVASTAVLGEGVRVQNNVSVYDGVRLEDEVFCGPSVVFTNVRNPRAHVSRKSEYRPTLVKRRATLGANATILPGVTIGRSAFVGAGSVVTRDVPDFALVIGAPARLAGWVCACGERLAFAVQPSGEVGCPACLERYRAAGDASIEPAT